MKSFANWVMMHKHENDKFGDVARDLCDDKNVKKTMCYTKLRKYLVAYPADDVVIEIIDELWGLYRSARKGQGSPP